MADEFEPIELTRLCPLAPPLRAAERRARPSAWIAGWLLDVWLTVEAPETEVKVEDETSDSALGESGRSAKGGRGRASRLADVSGAGVELPAVASRCGLADRVGVGGVMDRCGRRCEGGIGVAEFELGVAGMGERMVTACETRGVGTPAEVTQSVVVTSTGPG